MASDLVRIALLGQARVLSEDGSREYLLPRKTLNLVRVAQFSRPAVFVQDPSREFIC
jgi:hypothetical protein